MCWRLKLCFFLKIYILFSSSYFCRIHGQVKNCNKSYDWRDCIFCCLPGNWKFVHLKLILWPGHWGTLHFSSSRTCGISFRMSFVHDLSAWHTRGCFAAFWKTKTLQKAIFFKITMFWLCDNYTKISTRCAGNQSFASSAFAFSCNHDLNHEFG